MQIYALPRISISVSDLLRVQKTVPSTFKKYAWNWQLDDEVSFDLTWACHLCILVNVKFPNDIDHDVRVADYISYHNVMQFTNVLCELWIDLSFCNKVELKF